MALPDLYDPRANNLTIKAGTTRYDADGAVYLPWVFDPASLRNPGTTLVEIPILDPPCSFTVDLPNGTVKIRLTYCDTDEGGWIVDLSTNADVALVHGIPLVTGLDLLGPYGYLNLGGRMFVISSGDPATVPGFADLGTEARLYFELAA